MAVDQLDLCRYHFGTNTERSSEVATRVTAGTCGRLSAPILSVEAVLVD
jgi:hypothetical protein